MIAGPTNRSAFAVVIILILTFSSGAGCSSAAEEPVRNGSELRLMTLNIHYLVPGADRTGWEDRKYALTASIKETDPDLLLFQEMETFTGGHVPESNLQLDWVMDTVSGYSVAAVGNPESFPITQPILYKTERFGLLDQGFFFFSETPDLIYSEPWNGRWPAFTTWILLEDLSSGEAFHVYNIHLDAFSRTNRIKGSDLIRDRIVSREPGDSAVLLAGDFNGLKTSTIVRRMTEADLSRAPADRASFHFGSGLHLYGAIDHIFYNDRLQVVSAEVMQNKWNGEWVSDHHPVIADLRLKR